MLGGKKLNITNIKVGETYKNYKQLCELLEIEVKGGNAKKAQLKEWERFFKYEKEGNKFTITSIYETPLPENHNKTKYIPTIEKLIIDKLVQDSNKGQVFISKSKLMSELKMINQNYTYAKYKQLRLSKHMNITLEEIEEFYLTSDDLLKRNIEAALNSLRNQSLIFWSNVMTLCFIETQADINLNYQIKARKEERVNEYGEEDVTFSGSTPTTFRTYRKATPEEVELVLRVEKEVLESYECDSINNIFKRNLSKRFYKDVREVLFDLANIYFYFNSYEIICNEKYIFSKWEQLEDLQLELDERELSMSELNSDIMDRITSNASKRQNRANDKLSNCELATSKLEMRTNEGYTDNNHRLTDTLINKDALSLVESFNIN